MGNDFIEGLLSYLKSAIELEYEECFGEGISTDWIDTYYASNWSPEEFERIYRENTGESIPKVTILKNIECGDIKFGDWPSIEVIRVMDAYQSMLFWHGGERYYMFSNYDESSLCDEYEFEGDLLTSFLFFSISQRRFFAFHVGVDKQGEFKVINAQHSEEQPKLLVDLLSEGEGFGKRSFYWHPKSHDVAIRFSPQGLNQLGKKSPEVYDGNMSGTRLEIQLIDSEDGQW